MSDVKSYRDLKVWQESMRMVELAYDVTKSFPSEERFGITSQIRRAAVSVPANISEGHARTSRKEYCHHLAIARGSLAELETEIQIATRLSFVERHRVVELWSSCQEVGKMLNGLIRSLRR